MTETAPEGEDLLLDELYALEAIFGEDCEANIEDKCCTLYVPAKLAEPRIQLTMFFSDAYPASDGPCIELVAPQLSVEQLDDLHYQLEDLFLPGEVVGFNMADLLRERKELWGSGIVDLDEDESEGQCDDSDNDQPSREDAPSKQQLLNIHQQQLTSEFKARIISGEPYTERKSTFQAHVAHVMAAEEVDTMMAVLLQDSKIRRASHNMLAYRIATTSGTYIQDYDDDGESAAGSRLLHLLQVAGVENVCVVVSRWFGGTKLGPSRFTIINNTARQLLVAEGMLIQHANAKKSWKR